MRLNLSKVPEVLLNLWINQDIFTPDTKAKNLGPGGNVLRKPVRQTPVMPELQLRDFISQNISKLIHIHHQIGIPKWK